MKIDEYESKTISWGVSFSDWRVCGLDVKKYITDELGSDIFNDENETPLTDSQLRGQLLHSMRYHISQVKVKSVVIEKVNQSIETFSVSIAERKHEVATILQVWFACTS